MMNSNDCHQMHELSQIQDWYASQCDGSWEHSNGVQIESLDNPGWYVKIDIRQTDLAERTFESVAREAGDDSMDWVHCKVEAGQFIGAGGPRNLAELLAVFLTWAKT
jgi:hypothetical protein